MCGRSACNLNPQVAMKVVSAARFEKEEEYVPSYNVPPYSKKKMPVLLKDQEEDVRILRAMQFGLIPSFQKGTKSDNRATFNARADGLAQSSLWRRLINKKRCCILAIGFFEWKKGSPMFIRHKEEDKAVLFAGLYDVHRNEETGEELYSYTIITTEPNKTMSSIHNRMPVILDDDGAVDRWLSDEDYSTASALLKPYEGELEAYEVPPLVGKLGNDSKKLIMRVEEYKNKVGIGRFFKSASSASSSTTTTPKKKKAPEETKANDESPSRKRKHDEIAGDDVSKLSYDEQMQMALALSAAGTSGVGDGSPGRKKKCDEQPSEAGTTPVDDDDDHDELTFVVDDDDDNFKLALARSLQQQ